MVEELGWQRMHSISWGGTEHAMITCKQAKGGKPLRALTYEFLERVIII